MLSHSQIHHLARVLGEAVEHAFERELAAALLVAAVGHTRRLAEALVGLHAVAPRMSNASPRQFKPWPYTSGQRIEFRGHLVITVVVDPSGNHLDRDAQRVSGVASRWRSDDGRAWADDRNEVGIEAG